MGWLDRRGGRLGEIDGCAGEGSAAVILRESKTLVSAVHEPHVGEVIGFFKDYAEEAKLASA